MSTIDDVKARLDIVDVVGGYVPLKKAGRYFRANCPFHTEKTPSFIVYPDRQSWHCFGACATGGDVLSFVARKENLDFSATLRLLAERAGVELRSDGPRREQLKTLQDANEAAALFYHSLLQNQGPARTYAEARGLDATTIGDFQIGYAPPGWDGLRGHLTERGFEAAKLVEAGLLIESDRGGYDRFRNRLMFPIRDERGRVAGFGGRIIPPSAGSAASGPAREGSQPPQPRPEAFQGASPEAVKGASPEPVKEAGPERAPDNAPKYMNTPQTPVFDKGGVLYGLDRAKREIRQGGVAVIVEGYMDAVAAHQHGFRNVVASMGTALTDRQALLLQRFAGAVVLAMDADEAGSAAALRGVQVVAATTERATRSPAPGRSGARALEIKVLALPAGKDPDELIRSDAPSWQAAVNTARPVVEHLFAVVSAGLDLVQPRDRSLLVTELLPAIGEIADPVLRAHYLQRLSRLARVSEEALRRELPRPRSAGRRPAVREDAPPKLRRPVEEFCLALLYREPSLRRFEADLDEGLFSLSENQELYRRWRDGGTVQEEESELWEHLEAVLTTRFLSAETTEAEAAFLDCKGRLEQVRIKALKEASALVLAEGEAGLRPGQVASIARDRLEAGTEEAVEDDDPAAAAASHFLEDMEAGLRFHHRLIEGSRSAKPEETLD